VPVIHAATALPAGKWQPPRARNSAAYESGAHTRRTLTWRAPTTSPNTAILYNLTTMRDRSRTATRNDGYAKGIIDTLVSEMIGTGIKPRSNAPDAMFREAVHAAWLEWTDESDADGLLDFYGQQAQMVRGWLEGGEVFIRLRPRLTSDGLTVPLQLQVLEPELCPHTYTLTLPTGNRVRAGIEFDAIGRRIAYWFHPSRPDTPDDYDRAQLRRVPADAVIHLFDPLRPGQIRGVPHLVQALIKLYELDKFDDATLLRQQLANLFVGFLKRPAPIGEGADVHPLTGLAATDTESDRPVIDLKPGMWQELEPGEEVEFSDPPEVGSGYKDFTAQQLFHIAAAAGVPYEFLSGDLSKVNDRTVRIILNKFRRQLMAWQHQRVAFQVCRPIWRAWLQRAYLASALPFPGDFTINPRPSMAVSWMPQRWPYLHPVQDVQADKDAIRAGFTSRSAVVSEHGEDAEAIDQEQAEDNARADELHLRYDSDGRQAPSGAAAAPAADDENAGTPAAAPSPPASQATANPIVVRVTTGPTAVRLTRGPRGEITGFAPEE
jgi:lambda family phage portal protein